MDTGFDTKLLNEELFNIDNIDMSDFDFKIDFDDIFKENERHRTNDTYNLGIMDNENVSDFWQMPIIKNDNFIPSKLIGFNYAKTSKERFKNYAFGMIHFVIAIINARYIADELLKPEPEEIPEGSMEDVSEKEFVDKEIEAEVQSSK